jgi:hypothetical protein
VAGDGHYVRVAWTTYFGRRRGTSADDHIGDTDDR